MFRKSSYSTDFERAKAALEILDECIDSLDPHARRRLREWFIAKFDSEGRIAKAQADFLALSVADRYAMHCALSHNVPSGTRPSIQEFVKGWNDLALRPEEERRFLRWLRAREQEDFRKHFPDGWPDRDKATCTHRGYSEHDVVDGQYVEDWLDEHPGGEWRNEDR